MSRRVRVSPKADADIRLIGRSIRDRVSARSSDRWAVAVKNAITELATTAEQHPEADEAASVGWDLRMRLVGRRPHVYRILFTYGSGEVFVHRVRHAAQDAVDADDL